MQTLAKVKRVVLGAMEDCIRGAGTGEGDGGLEAAPARADDPVGDRRACPSRLNPLLHLDSVERSLESSDWRFNEKTFWDVFINK